MTENNLRKKFLSLCTRDSRQPRFIPEWEKLRQQAEEGNFPLYMKLIDWRIATLQRRYEDALKLSEEILDGEPDERLALWCKAFSLTDAGECEVARAFLSTAIISQPDPVQLVERIECATICDAFAYVLVELKRYDEALLQYGDIIRQFSNERSLELRIMVVKAMFGRAVVLDKLDNQSEALTQYDEVIEKFRDAEEVQLRELVATAMFNRGVTLGKLDKQNEKLVQYDEVILTFGDAKEVGIRVQVATTMFNRGVALGELGDQDSELAQYDEVIEKFGDAEGIEFLEVVAMAMFNRGIALGNIDKQNEKLSQYEEVIEKFRDTKEVKLRVAIAKAMYGRGYMLCQLDNRKNALVQYDEIIKKFGDDEEEMIRDICQSARFLKARLLEEQGGERKQVVSDRKELRKDALEMLKYYRGLASDHLGENVTEYFDRINKADELSGDFLHKESHFDEKLSFLMVLREWNSFTPTIPTHDERDRGGGYYLQHQGVGVVIDPGYDFIENFYQAGGRLRDIDHIVITHAHDDHTAQLETLLMQIVQFDKARRIEHEKELEQWKEADSKGVKPEPSHRKQVSLYMSEGAQRKFAGLVPLRKDSRLKRVVTLARPEKDELQEVKLGDHVLMTVLPAYHADVITVGTAVGLGFELSFPKVKGVKRIVMTGDTGYYPPILDKHGEPEEFDGDEWENRPSVEPEPERGLAEIYPRKFKGIVNEDNTKLTKRPDLLVAHIGSIKKYEFRKVDVEDLSKSKAGSWYYPNHLGVLGTLTLLDQLYPRTALISEFGSELRGFHAELVKQIGTALCKSQDGVADLGMNEKNKTQVFVGDANVVYYINPPGKKDKILCHETGRAKSVSKVVNIESIEWTAGMIVDSDVPSLVPTSGKRPYICKRQCEDGKLIEKADVSGIRDYYDNQFRRRNLPHFKIQDKKKPGKKKGKKSDPSNE
jgi:tetratricopeptide (TPR) repeat protein